MTSPALDSIGTWGTNWNSSATTVSTTQSTNQSPDIIMALVFAWNQSPSTTFPTVSGVTATGLTFTRRSTVTFISGTNYCTVETWWAPAASTLSSKSITATVGATTSYIFLETYAVHGTFSQTAPFDPNGVLPVNATGSGNPVTGTMSTSNADDLLVAFACLPTASTGAPSGWSAITNGAGGFGASYYESVSGVQTGTVVSTTAGSSVPYALILDAFTADANIVSGAGSLTGAGSLAGVGLGATTGTGTLTGAGTLAGIGASTAASVGTLTGAGSLSAHPVVLAAGTMVGAGSLAGQSSGGITSPPYARAARESQAVLLCAYVPPPTRYARESQESALIAERSSTGSSTNVTPRLSQLAVLAAFGTGIPAQVRTRAWTFTMDGHTFYVLDLGAQGTFVYDQITQQWAQFETDGFYAWNLKVGTQWEQTRVVGGDSITGQVWELDPTAVQDEGWRDIQHTATGGIGARSRIFRSVEAVRLSGSVGQIDEVNGATFNLSFSDDQGKTWNGPFPLALVESDFDNEIAWRSLGSFNSPGRIFQLDDVGGIIRIDGMDAFIDEFDEETSPQEEKRG